MHSRFEGSSPSVRRVVDDCPGAAAVEITWCGSVGRSVPDSPSRKAAAVKQREGLGA